MEDFNSRLNSNARAVEECLVDLLSDNRLAGETARPKELMAAMRHSTLDGGKRLRPFLVIETTRMFGGKIENAILTGSALELIHCYSLVHDDLPSMDDDELRRGRPTTHIEYGEATAILAGDALLTLAFDVLSRERVHPDPLTRIELVNLFARNAGLGGMVGGQVLDLEAETKNEISDLEILTMQAMKTGALIRCACEAGAILSRASQTERETAREFGRLIGQAFQLADDILDETSDAKTMGKNTGKDATKGKGTLVSLYGLEKAKERADELLNTAIQTVEPYGEKAEILIEAAKFTVSRKS